LYNFPSKIGEFLCYNKKVISTIKYPNLDDLIEYAPYDPQKLADVIRKYRINKQDEISLYEHFGPEKFREKLRQLIEGLKQ
jgi:hypothetical protein